MAIKKIKIGGTTYDINDAREVVIGNGVENIVTLTSAQYDALATKDPATAYIVTDMVVPVSSSGGGGGEENVIESISVNGTPQEIVNKNVDLSIPDEITTSEFIGSMYRNNVSGTGNISISGKEGVFPTVPAGTYIVKIYSTSSTQSYTLNVNFGGQTYSLSTTEGLIRDTRTFTFATSATWSASISTVASGTVLSVKLYDSGTPVTTVGLTAVTNDYNDLDNLPDLTAKQDTLVSGTNIKTINNTSLLGSGNITISGGSGSGISDVTLGGTSVVTNNVAALPAYPTSLPASDVSSWAKASSKPTYTASEVGALPDTTIIPTVPTISTNITTDATSDTKTASPKAVKTYVDGIVGDIETLLAAI